MKKPKGPTPVEIPTKKYIRAYIISKYGDRPLIDADSSIGAKLYDILQHTTNQYGLKYRQAKQYNTSIKLFIPYSWSSKRGGYLNETNTTNFNLFIEKEIKDKYRFIMDFYTDVHPSFTHNLPQVRRWLGITADDWDDDSMKKDYYRYRKRESRPSLYKNICAESVPRNLPSFL